ncbi:trypsin-like serine peptidase [Amycolatopsis sp. cmx-11-12]|uniref:trypsin-like serine peptidase n=1 Tax=Amycolatopsis sp. cmx-11-12 TaxID=2785795 RepID=UPI00391724E1
MKATRIVRRALIVVTGLTLLSPPALASADEPLRYWTTDRMAAAEPESSSSAQVLISEPGVGAALPPTPLTASPRPYTDPGERAHGKVFYTKGGRNTWCSSAVATAPNKSLVWTAAHCVSGASNVIFVPAYNSAGGNDAPYGRWPARRVRTSGNDHAVVVVGQVGGRSLEEVVGANGIRFNGPLANRTTIWGYPGARQWTGRDLTYCDVRAQSSGSSVSTSCVTQPGSSGGGYVTGAATPAGLGYLWANHTAGDGAGHAVGSVFGATAKQLYDANSSH